MGEGPKTASPMPELGLGATLGGTRCGVTGSLPPKVTASQGSDQTAPRAGSQSCLVFRLGAQRGGAVHQERWDIWVGGWDRARGDRPSSAVRLSHGFLPSAQLPKLLNLSDSL